MRFIHTKRENGNKWLLSLFFPTAYIERTAGRVPTIVLTSTVRQAVKAEEADASAVIVVGQEGGGNIGRADTGTMALTPQAVDAVSIPILAAGGIADGRGLLAALALGAEGIEMGTRFVAVQECPADDAWKQMLIEAGDQGTMVIQRHERMRTRVLAQDAAAMSAQAEDGAETATVRSRGAGQGAGLIYDIPSAKDLIQRLRREVEEGHARIAHILGSRA